jgi:iron-regulated transporter 1
MQHPLLDEEEDQYTETGANGLVATPAASAAAAATVASTPCAGCAAILPLYISHGFSAWGDRMWQFALGLMMSEVWLGTLLPISMYSFAIYLTAFILVPVVGAWIDRADRLVVMFVSIIVENVCIVSTCVAIGLLPLLSDWPARRGSDECAAAIAAGEGASKAPCNPTLGVGVVLCYLAIVLSAVAGELAGTASTIALECDWVVVIAAGDSQRLAHYNKTLRQIDLVCKFVAPMLFGIVFTTLPLPVHWRVVVGAAFIAAWNVISTPIEYFTARVLYRRHATLSASKAGGSSSSGSSGGGGGGCGGALRQTCDALRNIPRDWSKYINHAVFWGSVGYCFLYLTVLDFGNYMVAFLTSVAVSAQGDGSSDGAVAIGDTSLLGVAIGTGKGAGAVFGLLGTMIFPAVLMCSGGSLERAGVYTVWGIFLTLAPLGVLFALRRWAGAGSDGGVASEVTIAWYVLFCLPLPFTRILLTI